MENEIQLIDGRMRPRPRHRRRLIETGWEKIEPCEKDNRLTTDT
jgi:hypothetical protein